MPANPAVVKAMVEDSGTGVGAGGVAGLPEITKLSIRLFPIVLDAPLNRILKPAFGLLLSPGILLKSKL